MPRFDKWLTGIRADTRVDRVAKQALKMRLRAVVWYLGRACEDDPEVVHQLRIWTRRGAATLKLFAVTLPKRRRRWMQRALRKIRRTAGRVRDCDVLIGRLQSEERSKRLNEIVRRVKQERRRAQKDLKTLRRKLVQRGRLTRESAKLLEKVAWPKRHSSRAAPTFAPWCRQQLAPLAAAFFRLGEANLSTDGELHAFRLAGKRLRYALELAASAVHAPTHRQFYEELSELQDKLGEVCDRLAAVGQFEAWLAAETKATRQQMVRTLVAEERRKLDKARGTFQKWWTAPRRQKLRGRWAAIRSKEARSL